MAVFFRINCSEYQKFQIEISIGILSKTIYLEFRGNDIILIVKAKKLPIRNTEYTVDKVVTPSEQIATVFNLKVTSAASANLPIRELLEKLLIMIFSLFKNTNLPFSLENIKKQLVFSLAQSFFFELSFGIRLNIKGIISYLIKILKLRRKDYGSKF